MFRITPLRAIFLSWLALCVAACSAFKDTFPDKRVEYEKATSLPSLEIPPDLAAPGKDDEMAIPSARPRDVVTRYSDYTAVTAEQRAAATAPLVLPSPDDIKVVREAGKRWLVVRNTPEQIWGKVHDFWLDQGFLLKVDDPKTGVLETDWLENRANIPQSGVRALFGKVLDGLYDSSTRDRFRVRLERGEAPDTTEIYISHLGAEEVTKGDSTAWQMRSNDPELEAVMLQRLVVFMGVQENKAKTLLAVPENRGDRAQLISEGGSSVLMVDEDFARTWRHAGLALDQVGFTVEDRNRNSGVYYVRYNDPLKDSNNNKGFLSKLAFWSSDTPSSAEQYQIHLQERDKRTEVTVLTKDGTRDTSPTGQRILTLLRERLR
ncbi:Outer membrane protein assembly factor BamC [Gammaproteobacteria bacterium]